MIISHKHKFIFFKTRKTAGSSLQVALAQHCGPDDIITGQYRLGIDDHSHSAGLNMDKFFTHHPHPELIPVKNFLTKEVWDSYFKFAFVRNPFDVAVSRYHWDLKGKKGLTETSVEGFKEWVRQGNLYDRDQAHFYTAYDGYVDLDFIGYYENLEEDIKHVCKVIGIPSLDMPSLKSGYRDNSSYAAFYDEETKKRVQTFFAADFNLYGYNFENKNTIKKGNIITSKLFEKENDNIGTPCIIQVPDWIENKLGNLYMYFSNHDGTSIKLAYADSIEGPWAVVEDVLNLKATPCKTHIASPEVVIDEASKELKMYYHGNFNTGQGTLLATSKDGVAFTNTTKEMLCDFYLRIFTYNGTQYGIAKKGNKGGIIYNVDNNFEPLFEFLPSSRHCHAIVKEDKLYITYSVMGHSPEHIRLCVLKLDEDVNKWDVLSDTPLIWPTFKYEGADTPVVVSHPGSATARFGKRIQELRDPFMFELNEKVHILYVTQGERAIAYAQLTNFYI